MKYYITETTLHVREEIEMCLQIKDQYNNNNNNNGYF